MDTALRDRFIRLWSDFYPDTDLPITFEITDKPRNIPDGRGHGGEFPHHGYLEDGEKEDPAEQHAAKSMRLSIVSTENNHENVDPDGRFAFCTAYLICKLLLNKKKARYA
jgi:hypothetical protein